MINLTIDGESMIDRLRNIENIKSLHFEWVDCAWWIGMRWIIIGRDEANGVSGKAAIVVVDPPPPAEQLAATAVPDTTAVQEEEEDEEEEEGTVGTEWMALLPPSRGAAVLPDAAMALMRSMKCVSRIEDGGGMRKERRWLPTPLPQSDDANVGAVRVLHFNDPGRVRRTFPPPPAE